MTRPGSAREVPPLRGQGSFPGSTRSLVGLTLVALALWGYLWVDTDRTQDDLETERRILPGFGQWTLSRIRLMRPRRPALDLVRSAAGWELGPGRGVAADEEGMQRVLATLEFVRQMRWVPERSNPRQLGLAPPQGAIELLVGSNRVARIELGREDPSGRGVYIRYRGRVLVAERELGELLDLDPGTLRDRDLLRPGSGAIRSLRIDAEGRDGLTLSLVSGRYLVRGADRALTLRAAPDAALRLFNAVAGLRVSRFLARAPRGTASTLGIQIVTDKGQQQLQVGPPCPGYPDERVVLARDSVSCVADVDLRLLEQTRLESLWDRQLIRLQEHVLKRIELPTLQLRREAGRWRFTEGEAADADVIREWIGSLAGILATRSGPVPADWRPAMRLSLVPEEGDVDWIDLGAVAGTEIPVKRSGETGVVWIDLGGAELVRVDRLMLRDRNLLRLSPHLVTRLVTRRVGEREVLQRGEDGAWQVVEPSVAPADRGQVEQLIRLLSRLRARRFLKDAPGAGPLLSLDVTLTRESLDPTDAGVQQQTVGLRIRQAGVCQGQLAGAPGRDPPWFELEPFECQLLRQRHMDPRLLRLDRVGQVQLKLASGSRLQRAERGILARERSGARETRLVAIKHGPTWIDGDGRQLPTTTVAGLLRLLQDLKGEILSYGGPAIKPWLVVEAGPAGGQRQRCVIDRQGRARGVNGDATHQLGPGVVAELERLLATLKATPAR